MENIDIIKKIEEEKLGKILTNVPFKNLTTYKLGGVASVVFFPNSVLSLIKVLKLLKEEKKDYKVFGRGSNIIPSDDNYDGLIIKLDQINDIKFEKNYVTVGAGGIE